MRFVERGCLLTELPANAIVCKHNRCRQDSAASLTIKRALQSADEYKEMGRVVLSENLVFDTIAAALLGAIGRVVRRFNQAVGDIGTFRLGLRPASDTQ